MTSLPKIRADFNGLFGELLCISHGDTARLATGDGLRLFPGQRLIAFDDDADEHGAPDELRATGTVEPSPDWLSCQGSRWVLRIDHRGVYHASDLLPWGR